jgi:hypothetical protein
VTSPIPVKRGGRSGTARRSAPSSDEKSWSASSRGGLGQQIWPELMPTLLKVDPKMFFSTPPKANTMTTISAAMPGDARTHIGVSDPDSGMSVRCSLRDGRPVWVDAKVRLALHERHERRPIGRRTDRELARDLDGAPGGELSSGQSLPGLRCR